MNASRRAAGAVLAYAVAPGVQGGMGHHAAQVLEACARISSLTVCGPEPLHTRAGAEAARFVAPPAIVSPWQRRYTWRRYLHGPFQLEQDRRFGRWLAEVVEAPRRAYLFTQIACEALGRWRGAGTTVALDNPNGHIRHYRNAVAAEADRWLTMPYPQHPTAQMVERVEEEYAGATRIRVASRWAARSMADHGVPSEKLEIVPHAVDLRRFTPGASRENRGPLRIVFVGSISLGKGFPYLLEAVRRVGPDRCTVKFVGGTGDPWCRRLFDRLRHGLQVEVSPGDPVPAYQDADLFVLPTLHDGFGFVVAEAMACGLPVITTDACGAAEWVRDGESGWIVKAGDADALAAALEIALAARQRLQEMGREARASAVALGGGEAMTRIRRFVERALELAPAPISTVTA
jgi:glycosyltransferase involved in cell wall biosynthesis